MGTHRNAKGSVGHTASRYPGQQMALAQTGPLRILQECQHPRSVVPCITTNLLHPHCGQFWHQIQKSGRCWSFNFQHKKDIHVHQKLNWQLILWDHTRVGLRPSIGEHINAGIHQEETTRIHMASPSNCKIVHTHPNPRNLVLKHKPPSPLMTQQSLTKRASKASKNSLEVSYILRPCGGYDYDGFDGSQFHCCGANKSHGKDTGPVHPIIGLPLEPSRCKGTILCFGYDHKHPFWCFISIRSKCLKQGMWAFFHGMDAKGLWTHSIERGFPRQHHHHEICRHFCCQGQTWSSLPWFPNRNYFPTHLSQNGTSTDKKNPSHCNKATAVGIANNTIKRQRLRSMEMRFFWVGDKIAQEMYALQLHPGQENLVNYQSKHHVGSHHATVRPWYLHMENSPQI